MPPCKYGVPYEVAEAALQIVDWGVTMVLGACAILAGGYVWGRWVGRRVVIVVEEANHEAQPPETRGADRS